VNVALREVSIGVLCVGISKRSIYIVIPPGVLLVRWYLASKFILWRLKPDTDRPLKMMFVLILCAICKRCCLNRFATAEVAISTENVVILALGAGIYFKSVRGWSTWESTSWAV